MVIHPQGKYNHIHQASMDTVCTTCTRCHANGLLHQTKVQAKGIGPAQQIPGVPASPFPS
jgi:hypothetical protein